MSDAAAQYGETLFLYLDRFAVELQRAGVAHVCICPGSRSTPLAMTFARRAESRQDRPLKLWMHIDERSAGFFALGLAKMLQEPVALVCTSGTAAANFFPAVVEAFYARVPLLVLSADRPHAARDRGAAQTIDQIRLFGHHVKQFVEVAPPDDRPAMLRYIATVAGRAVSQAMQAPAGPVHLNFPFDEPLIPMSPAGGDPADRDEAAAVRPLLQTPDPGALAPLAEALRAARRGLIVCGPQENSGLAGPLLELASVLGFPVLADPLSQVRCSEAVPAAGSPIVDHYDALLRDERFAAGMVPDFVLRFGAPPTSKALSLYLDRHRSCRQVIVDPGAGWQDPYETGDELLYAEPAELCRVLLRIVTAAPAASAEPEAPAAGGWLSAWRRAGRCAQEAIAAQLERFDELFDGRVYWELASLLPRGAAVFAGNSMPVRDLDSFFPSRTGSFRFLANRGANGIDGVVSSALGAAAALASGGEEAAERRRPEASGRRPAPLVLVIGDLSFYHDLNGLLAAKLQRINATVILIHNDGGGIFSFLPQAEHPEYFERLFGTPTGLDFEPAVRMYGGRFERVGDWPSFRRTVGAALEREGLDVVEIRSDRRRNVDLHRQVWRAVSQALADAGLDGAEGWAR